MPPTATETERVVNPAATAAAPGTDTLVPSLNGDYLRGVSALWRVARMALGYRVRFPAAVLAVIGAAVFQLLIPRFLGRAVNPRLVQALAPYDTTLEEFQTLAANDPIVGKVAKRVNLERLHHALRANPAVGEEDPVET